MINRNKDMYRIKFFEDALFNPSQKKEAEVSDLPGGNIKVPLRPQRPTRSNNSNAITSRTGHVILSAGEGNINNQGGPSQQAGARSNNSIWDNDVLSRLIDQTTNKEETAKHKERIDRLRNSLKDGRIDEMVESINTTETKSDATVTQIGNYQESAKYKTPSNSIGIFDNNEFVNVPDQTHGEKVAMEARQPKEVDDSWKNMKGASRMSKGLDNLFDILTKDKDA